MIDGACRATGVNCRCFPGARLTSMRYTKQLKEESAKAKADVEKTEKALADAKNVITSKDSEIQSKDSQIQSWKEQVKCVLVHFFRFVSVPANVDACTCVFV